METRLNSEQRILISENMKLVYHVSKKYYFAEKEDLQSIGVLGLIDAAKSYDPNRGVKFSTWAYRSINWKLAGELKKSLAQKEIYIEENQEIEYNFEDLANLINLLPKALKPLLEAWVEKPELSHKELADALKITKQAVGQKIQKIRKIANLYLTS